MPELVRTATIHHVHSNNSEHSLCKRLSHDYHAWRWVQINVPASAGQTLIVGGRTAVLGQFHWHASSEHTVDNLHHAMKMHFVLTYSDTGEQACTAVNCLHRAMPSSGHGADVSQQYCSALGMWGPCKCEHFRLSVGRSSP